MAQFHIPRIDDFYLVGNMFEPFFISLSMNVLFIMHFGYKFICKRVPQSTQIFKLGEVIANADGVYNRSSS